MIPRFFFPLLSPGRDKHRLPFQLLGMKTIPEAGLLSAGFHPPHIRQAPGIPPKAGSGQLPACVHPSGAACAPEPMDSCWGAAMGSSASGSGQGRRRMERGRRGGLPRAKRSARRAAGAGPAGPRGRDGI